MKILMVNKFLYPNGGSETYIFKLGEYFNAHGHEVQFFGMQDDRNIVGNKAASYTGNMDFHSGKLQKLLYPIRIIYSKESRKQIRRVIDDFHPDIVHLNNINFQITPSIIYEIKKSNIPIVWTLHDYQLVCPNHMLYDITKNCICEQCLGKKYGNCTKNRCIHGSRVKSMLGTIEARYYSLRKTYKKVDSYICPTAFIEKKLLTDRIFEGRTTVLHNFIDCVEEKKVDKQPYVLYFGRFSEEKGIRTILQAAKRLPLVKFIFAGKGPLEEEITGVPNVENVGFRTGNSLEMLIREARFSLYTSEWYENCPFSVMESQMYGTPVIGADIGGIPELIQDGKTGLLFKSGDVDDLVKKITALWEDDAKLKQLTSQCSEIKFDTIDRYCEKLIKLYNNCIEKQH